MPQDRYAPAYTQRSVFVEDFSDSYPNDNDNNQDTLASRTPFYASTSSSSTELNPQRSGRLASPNLLYPPSYNQSTASLCSSASNTPVPSRAPSPLYAQDDDVSSCSSEDEETELESSSFLRNLRKRSASLTEVPRWWRDGPRRRRRLSWYRVFRRYILPFIPKTPLTIIFTLLLLTAFAISLANLIIYLCNPDKQPLPWRGYCTLPDYSTEPPPSFLGAYASFPIQPPEHIVPRSFPPDNLDTLAPIGVFVGVFSMDSGFERRALIRDTYASHPRSRNGAGEGDGGVGTSRTVVRFVMGRPRKDLERKVQLEMETYNDIIILPIKENMNDGKTYNFFKWAATGAWVPPLYFDNLQPIPRSLSYSNLTSPAPILAHHDPVHAHRDQLTGNPKPWVRPDFIIKADDDSFVMLAELEAHLRVEMHTESPPKRYKHQPELVAPPANHSVPTLPVAPNDDPMIFWGYPVKNRFMAGELYALTHTLVDWISKDKDVAANVRGAEDQITSRWVRWHPRSQDVRWVRERCWVYDHPKAGTVYSRGFLFPSEAKRVQSQILGDLARWKKALRAPPSSPPPPGALDDYVDPFGPQGGTPPNWVLSSVATFQVRYSPPVQGFSLNHSLEALVEGSELSKMKQRNVTLWDEAYNRREGRITQYQGKRVGGTTVVHSIKKHMWFLETASALLEGDDYTELELAQMPSSGHSSQHKLKPLGRRHRSHLLPTPPHLT